MYCKTITSKKYWFVLLLAGAVSLAFGIIGVLTNDEGQNGNFAMLLGIFTGMGGVLVCVSIIRLIYMAIVSPKKLKREENILKDERNFQILRASYTVSNMVSSLMFAIMAFVFVTLGYKIPAYCAIGAIWVQVVVFLVSHRVYSRKM